MGIRVLEIHHHAVRIDSEPPKVEAVRKFYADVLGLEADPGTRCAGFLDQCRRGWANPPNRR
jgi:hypothetical protein